MTEFAYSNSPYAICPDLPDAFRYTWQKIANPGTWFSGAERVAIAQGVEAHSGISAEKELIAFVEATFRDTPDLADTQEQILAKMGNDGLIDAAAVVGNFQRMVRIADGTGIPLDDMIAMVTADMRDDLGFNSFGSAGNTRPVNALKRGFARLLEPFFLRRIRKRMSASESN